uniref:Cytochrome-b5 reductase n=1 Tax=Trichuris muris TaxID=70415 RepID=A0A5S6Q6Z8_TRIMR
MPASLSCTWSQDKIMLVFTVHHSGEALVGTVLSIFASPLLCRFRMFSRKKAAAIQWTFPDAVISTEAYVEHCKTDSSMVIFPKVERTTWNLRSISSTHLSFEEYGFKSCTVGAVSIVAQNVLRFDVEIEPSAAVSIPMGSHMVWKLGELNLLRCYSPVPSEMQLVDLGRFVNKLTFMIKLYPDSASSKYIGQLKAGKVVEVSDPLPSLTLNTQRLIESTQVTLISGGTGINPFPRLVLSLLKSTSASIDLVAFFRKLQDVFWRDELLQLSSSFPNRLRVSFVLDEADPKWTSYCGGLNSDILARLLPTFSEMACACVCGKEGFCDMVKRYLNELGWYEDAITTL